MSLLRKRSIPIVSLVTIMAGCSTSVLVAERVEIDAAHIAALPGSLGTYYGIGPSFALGGDPFAATTGISLGSCGAYSLTLPGPAGDLVYDLALMPVLAPQTYLCFLAPAAGSNCAANGTLTLTGDAAFAGGVIILLVKTGGDDGAVAVSTLELARNGIPLLESLGINIDSIGGFLPYFPAKITGTLTSAQAAAVFSNLEGQPHFRASTSLYYRTPTAEPLGIGPLNESFGLVVASTGEATVTRVGSGSRADQAGLQLGDTILAVNGIDVTGRAVLGSPGDFVSHLAIPDNSGRLTVRRDGVELDIVVEQDATDTLIAMFGSDGTAFNARVVVRADASGRAEIVSVAPGSAEARVGLAAGDVVTHVRPPDESSELTTAGLALDQLAARGLAAQFVSAILAIPREVVLTVVRPGTEQPIEIKIERI